MTQDPFEEEARRRAEEIDRTDADRLEAIAEDEEPKYALPIGKPLDPQAAEEIIREEFGILQKVAKPRMENYLEEIYKKAAHDLESAGLPVPEARALPPRIGSWEPGNNKQDLQSMRFEMEAERALHLGKPVPSHDDELRQLHLKLNKAHVAYQRSGDASLLVAIADLKTQYERRQREIKQEQSRTKADERRDEEKQAEEHTEDCVRVTYPSSHDDCAQHGWPCEMEDWMNFADKRWPQKPSWSEEPKKVPGIQEVLRQDASMANHENSCMRFTHDISARCLVHDWPISGTLWDGGRYLDRALADRKRDHAKYCPSRSEDRSTCAPHGWPVEDPKREAKEVAHEVSCLRLAAPTSLLCTEHGWRVRPSAWRHERTKDARELSREESGHLVHCVDKAMDLTRKCSRHNWPKDPAEWDLHLARKGK